jgi:hypothetical protein
MVFDGTQVTIGKGAQAEVLLYQGYAYKVYNPSYPASWISYEKEIQDKVNRAGLTPVRYYDTDDPHIIRMDYVGGEVLEERARAQDLTSFDILADAFGKVHAKTVSDVPVMNFSQNAEYILKGDERKLVLDVIARLKERYGECLCHLDMHFLNIIVKPGSDEYTLIDWMNARIAPFVFDYARTYVIFDEFSQEGLAVYKERVLPRMWQRGVSEEDFEDAVKVCSILRAKEKRE